ncbi:hypothetical protein [Paraburkholderia xenovorans]|uniref:Uncharacterized protein n=1 Tax=Paraburkholderia xenovorans (strain LB400) TaxID=266265 RepID=Q141Z4_PARXL|nr:hypothetical protein [Paraburkholderia xenovorans]ABE29845.1 hypothetical protein Bxe_A3134 [Paraburkholderia xenovorans LB400]
MMTAINNISNTSFNMMSHMQTPAQFEGHSRSDSSTVRAFSSVENTGNVGGDMQRSDARAAWHAAKAAERSEMAESPAATGQAGGDTNAQDPGATQQTGGADPSQNGGSVMDMIKQLVGAVAQLFSSIMPLVTKAAGAMGGVGGA